MTTLAGVHGRGTPSRSARGRLLVDAGCALKKPPDAAAIKAEAMPTVQVPPQWTASLARAASPTTGWRLHDAQLTAAVAEAIANNADLRVAAARVEQAQLYAKLAGAKLYPSVDLLARGGGKSRATARA